MPQEFFDPTPEQQKIVLNNSETLQKAQRMIAGCEACSEEAELPFENILDRLTGSDPSVTDYLLEVPPGSLLGGTDITLAGHPAVPGSIREGASEICCDGQFAPSRLNCKKKSRDTPCVRQQSQGIIVL